MSNYLLIYVGDSEHFIFRFEWEGYLGWFNGKMKITRIEYIEPMKNFDDAVPNPKHIERARFHGISKDGNSLDYAHSTVKRGNFRKGFYLMGSDKRLNKRRILSVGTRR